MLNESASLMMTITMVIISRYYIIMSLLISLLDIPSRTFQYVETLFLQNEIISVRKYRGVTNLTLLLLKQQINWGKYITSVLNEEYFEEYYKRRENFNFKAPIKFFDINLFNLLSLINFLPIPRVIIQVTSNEIHLFAQV